MASIKLVLRTNQEDKTGHSPLYIRVIKDRKAKFVATGVKLKQTEWDDEKQKIKKNHPNSARMNAFLAQKIADAEGTVADHERKRKSVSARKLKEAIKGKDMANFFEYAYNRCERIKGTVSVATYKNYKQYVSKFEKFVGHRDVYFDDITVTMLKDYVNYLSNTLKNGATTVHYSLLILSVMFRDAQREDIISEAVYPFSKVKVKRDKGKRLYLNKEQIEKLRTLKIEYTGKDEIFRDMFIFAVYAGGLRFSDVVSLKWEHFNEKEQRITKEIRKTRRTHNFKIGQVALGILHQYKTEFSQPKDFVFPIIEDVELFDANEEYQAHIINAKNILCGQKLRRLGKDMELPFSLSFHLSRHTFATNALNNGMRIEYVSKLLDHSDIGITQIYAKVISEELDKAVEQYVI
ncbi:site-specific integrase [Chryseobacterium sp. RR2-3-20]|uniref:site-specific integrase n=1 Tax=Chryseobacterium sp. RR2-3-20 TaxID=2787626 RepID=UPI001AE0C3F0|nr:site-specific integrase [Chryseobacterium sp. RR2-3-20]